jgi:ankyrin repeat protein
MGARGARRRLVATVLGGALGALVSTHSAAAEDEETLQSLAARDAVARIAQTINAGVPVDERDDEGQTALHVAARESHLFSAMMLIAKGADPKARDRKKRTPLHLAADGDRAAEGERFQVLKLLIAKGGDLDARDVDGKRPVDYARVPEFRRALATSTPAPRRPSRGSP